MQARIMIGTVKKRDIRRLYHEIRKRSTFSHRGQNFWIANSRSKLPSYQKIKFATKRSLPRKIGFLTQAWNNLNQFRVWIAKKMYNKLSKPLQKIVQKIGRIEAHLHKKL